MTADLTAPIPSGAGPSRPDSGAVEPGLDPIFSAQEPVEQTTKRATLLFQFFLFPLMIVAAAVGVFLFFGAIGGTEKSAKDYLYDVRTGGENVQKQGAHQLAVLLARERLRWEAERGTERVPFHLTLDAEFRASLAKAFEDSFVPDRTADRRVFLASALGFVGDPAYAEPLAAQLKTDDVDLKRAVAKAIGELESDAVVPLLVPLLKDGDEPIRNFAVVGLSKHRVPASTEGLKGALSDESVFVQANAAGALALLGDDSGIELVAKLLDPAWVEKMLATKSASGGAGGQAPVDPVEELRQAALANGVRGALALKSARLRPLVVALQNDPDGPVRKLATDAIALWPQ